jgi:hypothetical protein
MKILEGIKTKQLEKYILKVRPTLKREVMAIPFSELKTFGLILDGRQPNMVSFVEQYQAELSAQGKEVTILAYIPKLAKGQSLAIPHYLKSDFNWMGVPKNPSIADFMHTNFDLLINFSPDKILPLECICALSQAKYIIGNSTNHFNYYYDFLIKLNNSNAPESFIENVHHYLNLQQQV